MTSIKKYKKSILCYCVCSMSLTYKGERKNFDKDTLLVHSLFSSETNCIHSLPHELIVDAFLSKYSFQSLDEIHALHFILSILLMFTYIQKYYQSEYHYSVAFCQEGSYQSHLFQTHILQILPVV